MGASLIIAMDVDETRLSLAKQMGANVVLDYRNVDVLGEIKHLTCSGADVAIEALGTQSTLQSALRCLSPGGSLSSLGVYSGKLAGQRQLAVDRNPKRKRGNNLRPIPRSRFGL